MNKKALTILHSILLITYVSIDAATVTAVAIGENGCSRSAEAQVNGKYTSAGLKALGISEVEIKGPKVYNTDLTANPPHAGHGSGVAKIIQTGTCVVTRDPVTREISSSTSFSTSRSTTPCEQGE